MAEEFKMLIKAGDNVSGVKKLFESNELTVFTNVCDGIHYSPLTYATYYGRYSVVKYLAGKINLDIPDKNGYTPLMRASERGHLEVAGYLLLSGANINYSNPCGCALSLAISNRHYHFVQFLIGGGADLEKIEKSDYNYMNNGIRYMLENVPSVKSNYCLHLVRNNSRLTDMLKTLEQEKLKMEIEIKRLNEVVENKEIECKKKIEKQEQKLENKVREWEERFKTQEDEWKKELIEKQQQLENQKTEWGKSLKQEKLKAEIEIKDLKEIMENKESKWKEKLEEEQQLLMDNQRDWGERFKAQEDQWKQRLNEELGNKENKDDKSTEVQKLQGELEETRNMDIDGFSTSDAKKRFSKEFLELMDFNDVQDIYDTEEDQFRMRSEAKKSERKILEAVLKKAENKIVVNEKIVEAKLEAIGVLKKECEEVESVVEEDKKRVEVLRKNIEENQQDIEFLEADVKQLLALLKLVMDQKKGDKGETTDRRSKRQRSRADDSRRKYESIIEDMKALTECQVCLESKEAIKLQCENAHLTCIDCLEKMSNKSCPSCRSEIKFNARQVNKICEWISLE